MWQHCSAKHGAVQRAALAQAADMIQRNGSRAGSACISVGACRRHIACAHCFVAGRLHPALPVTLSFHSVTATCNLTSEHTTAGHSIRLKAGSEQLCNLAARAMPHGRCASRKCSVVLPPLSQRSATRAAATPHWLHPLLTAPVAGQCGPPPRAAPGPSPAGGAPRSRTSS